MQEHIMDEKTGIGYTLQGDYYLPDLLLPVEKKELVGIWGQRHLSYLKRHRRTMYFNLLTSGKLKDYLASIDKQAEDMFFRLVKEYAKQQGVTEQLKAENQLEWVRKMNGIRTCAWEVVENEIIFR